MEYISDWTTRLRSIGILDVSTNLELFKRRCDISDKIKYLLCIHQLSVRTSKSNHKMQKPLGRNLLIHGIINHNGKIIRDCYSNTITKIFELEEFYKEIYTAEMMLNILKYHDHPLIRTLGF